MAVVATTPQGIGRVDGAGNRDALFLEIFSGEVLNKLDRKLTILDTMTTKRALAGAKTALFPIYGDASSSYHTPGEDILDDTNGYLAGTKFGDREIRADKVLQASEFVDDLEEKLNYWDHRSALGDKLSTAIQEQVEDTIFRLVIKGSGASAAVGSDVIGDTIAEWDTGLAEDMSAASTPTKLYDAVYSAAQNFDTKKLMGEGRFGAVNPGNFYALLRHNSTAGGATPSGAVIHHDFVNSGVNGDLARPAMQGIWIGNIFVMMSNGLPTTDTTTDPAPISGTGNDYRVDADAGSGTTDFRMLIWQRTAIGTVKVKEPTVEVTRWPNRLGTQITVSQAMGHNVLRPEACYSLTLG